MKLITVYNTEKLRWFDKPGPFFGILVSDGLYSVMRFDSDVRMKRTTPQEAKKDEQEYYNSLNKAKDANANTTDLFIPSDSIEIMQTMPSSKAAIVDKPVHDELDTLIDNMLEENEGKPQILSKPEITKYTEQELSKLTKKQMKQILRDRGYLDGPNAGRYHDTAKILIEKILRTQ